MLGIPTKCGNSYGGDRSCDARNIAVGVVADRFLIGALNPGLPPRVH